MSPPPPQPHNMDINTQIEKIYSSIEGFGSSITDLQNKVDQLNQLKQKNVVNSQSNPIYVEKAEALKEKITDSSLQLEHMIKNILDPDKINMTIKNMRTLEEHTKCCLKEMGDNHGK